LIVAKTDASTASACQWWSPRASANVADELCF